MIAEFALSIVGAIVSGVAADLIVGFIKRRRARKSAEPTHTPSVIAFDVVQMPEAPGLPGYDGKRRGIGFGRYGL